MQVSVLDHTTRRRQTASIHTCMFGIFLVDVSSVSDLLTIFQASQRLLPSPPCPHPPSHPPLHTRLPSRFAIQRSPPRCTFEHQVRNRQRDEHRHRSSLPVQPDQARTNPLRTCSRLPTIIWKTRGIGREVRAAGPLDQRNSSWRCVNRPAEAG